MKIRLVSLYTLFALSTSDPAVACEPAVVTVEERIRSSEIIFVGYVTGERFSDYESAVSSGGDPEGVPIWGERLVRVVPVEALRGKPPEIAEVPADCGQSSPEVFKRVVVFQEAGELAWVGLASSVEPVVRKQLAGGL